MNLELKKKNKPFTLRIRRVILEDLTEGTGASRMTRLERKQGKTSTTSVVKTVEGVSLCLELVPDEGPNQCQEGLHVPRSVDDHQGSKVFPKPEEESNGIVSSCSTFVQEEQVGYLPCCRLLGASFVLISLAAVPNHHALSPSQFIQPSILHF